MLGTTSAVAQQPQRLALVVSISQVGGQTVLESAQRDGSAVAAALSAGGFEVLVRSNPAAAELQAALLGFRERLRPEGIGLIVVTGLAAQVDGRNLLLTSDVALNEQQAAHAVTAMLRAAAVPLAELADALAGGLDVPRALIVDAAYRHPALARLNPPGLARPRLPAGTMALLGHAPMALQEAPPAGSTSRFAQVLAEALTTPRITLAEALSAVRLAVQDSTGGRTQPWIGGDSRSREHLADTQRLEGPASAPKAN